MLHTIKQIASHKKKKHFFIWLFAVFCVYLMILIYVTNPFKTITIVKNPYKTFLHDGEMQLEKKFELKVQKGFIMHSFGFVKSGAHILANVYIGSKKALSDNADEIVDEIYELRFNSDYPFLISGDHFSVLYPRSLGVFYLSALDPRIQTSLHVWQLREGIYLQTTAYVIDVFIKNGAPCTTIVPIGSRSVTCINVYSYPSDAIYSVLYALRALQTSEDIKAIYPMNNDKPYILQTRSEAQELIKENKAELKTLIDDYKKTVFDDETRLIKKDIHLSGAKDIIRRESAFYDNVIFWKTLSLADQLGIREVKKQDLDDLKIRIIKTFWYEKGGYFLEDLSEDSIEHSYYSSDWLVVLFTGFLDPKDPREQVYFQRSISYIRKEKLDEPFGLKYQQSNRASRAFLPVRIFLRSYGGTAIWSFWGTEYTKLLIILYRETGNEEYLRIAKQQIEAYSTNIETYKGFPEVYNSKGKMLSTFFYKSVRQTGWVINFEQAKGMLNSLP